MMQIELISDSQQLSAIAQPWNRLAIDVPFRTWDWLESWWRHFALPNTDLFVLVVHDECREVVGIAPWYRAREWGRGRQIRWLGSGKICSEYLTILCTPGQEAAVNSALADWLVDRARGEWDLLDLCDNPAGDLAIDALSKALTDRGCTLRTMPGNRCWPVRLPATWDEFIHSLSGQTRRKMTGVLRKVYETGRGQWREVKTAEDLAIAFEIVVDLHQRRQQSMGNAGCFAAPDFLEMQREVARRFFDRGMLRLQWLELDGRPVEVEYMFAGGTTVYRYITGFDPAAEKDRVGHVGIGSAIRSAIEGGFAGFDFLRGDEPYKALWHAEAHPSSTLHFVPPTRVAEYRYAAWSGYRATRSAIGRRVRVTLQNWKARGAAAKNDSEPKSPDTPAANAQDMKPSSSPQAANGKPPSKQSAKQPQSADPPRPDSFPSPAVSGTGAISG